MTHPLITSQLVLHLRGYYWLIILNSVVKIILLKWIGKDSNDLGEFSHGGPI